MSSLPTSATIPGYAAIFAELKEKIRQSRTKASLAVNRELLLIYWEIGSIILGQKKSQGWGSNVIKRLAADLKMEFPGMTGFSERNLVYMQTFADAYPELGAITQVPLAQLETGIEAGEQITQVPLAQSGQRDTIARLLAVSWYHHITLLGKIKDPEIRAFYITKTVENGWSRNVLVHQIDSGLHLRQGALAGSCNSGWLL